MFIEKENKKIIFILLMFVVAAFFVSCSNLTIKNETGAAITASVDGGDSFTIDSGKSHQVPTQVSLFESKTFAVKASGTYLSAGTTNFVLDGLKNQELKYTANQGVIKVHNISGRTIMGVYITKSSSSTWGGNLLTGTSGIGVGYTTSFAAFEGEYDIRIFDTSYVGAFYGFSVSAGTTVTRTWGSSSIYAPKQFSEGESPVLLKK